ncbi:MAG: MarR family transcriptional regulator [Phyllobacteriaceae bacterium]|nr:MarR family transcriptional regulator [Phyllobacteriaceae bacterium]
MASQDVSDEPTGLDLNTDSDAEKKARKAVKKAAKQAKEERKAAEKAAKKAEKAACKANKSADMPDADQRDDQEEDQEKDEAEDEAEDVIAEASVKPRAKGKSQSQDKAKAKQKADRKPRVAMALDGAVPPALSAALQAAARHARTALANELLAHGLYAGQEQVLIVLDAKGPQALGDLAEALSVRAPTITKTVTRMEAQGFLSRAISVEDARSIIISLTPEGRAALVGARSAIHAAEMAAFSTLSDDEKVQFLDLLQRVGTGG